MRRRAGIERELASSTDQIEMVWACGKNGVDGRSQWRTGTRKTEVRVDGVKMALGNRGMTVEAERQCAKDQKEWRALVHM